MRANSFFSREAGTSTLGWRAMRALRTRVNMSAMGSDVIYLPPYQLALVTPGISPARANFRKQIRQSENLRRNPRGRPHFLQRFRSRHLNFGVFCSLAIFAVVAIIPLLTAGRAFPNGAIAPALRRRSGRSW